MNKKQYSEHEVQIRVQKELLNSKFMDAIKKMEDIEMTSNIESFNIDFPFARISNPIDKTLARINVKLNCILFLLIFGIPSFTYVILHCSN